MAPRSGKRRHRHPPIPIWLPFPRPCLRSLNVPGPYYMPAPGMYLPCPLTPPYMAKPICHCVDDNFCTSSDCQNTAECLKTHPMYCPYGNKDAECDVEQNIIQEDEETHELGAPSDLGIDVCSSCGYTSKTWQKNGQAQLRCRPFQQDESDSSLYSSVQQTKEHNKKTNREKTSNTKNANVMTNNDRPVSRCADSTCQTSEPLNRIYPQDRRISSPTPPKSYVYLPTRTNRSTCSTFSNAESTEDHNRGTISKTTENLSSQSNNDKNSLGCSSCLRYNDSETDPVNPNMKNKPSVVDKLPYRLSQSRKDPAHKCCKSINGSSTSCKMQSAQNMKEDPSSETDKVLKNKKSTTNTPQTLPKKERSKEYKARKVSSCECSTRKSNDSVKNDLKKKSKTLAIQCECPVTKVAGNKDSSQPKGIKSTANLRAANLKSGCQCTFPPAFKHLSCKGSGTGNCSCPNLSLKTSK